MRRSVRKTTSIFPYLLMLLPLLFFSGGCGGGGGGESSGTDPTPTPTLSMPEKMCLVCDRIILGLENTLRSSSGLLYTNTSENTFLSETVSLEMLWRVRRNDKTNFDVQYDLMNRYFFGAPGLLYWKIGENLEPDSSSNASIDDLRACRALFEAHSRWGGEAYREKALELGRALLGYNVKDNVVVDETSWNAGGTSPGNYFSLSYGNLKALDLLAEADETWIPAKDATSRISWEGARGRELPYWGYDVSAGTYTSPDRNLINTLLHLLYLVEVGYDPAEALASIRGSISSEGVLTDHEGNESIACYGLAVLLFLETGEKTVAERLLTRLESFQREEGEDGAGLLAYTSRRGYTAWSFDNLLALLALDRYLEEE